MADQCKAKLLEYAIGAGDTNLAENVAKELAHDRMVVNLKQDAKNQSHEINNTIKVRISIEKSGVSQEITLSLQPTISFAALKAMIKNNYGIPTEKQRWIVGNHVANDFETLMDCDVTVDDIVIFCYVIQTDLVPSINLMEYVYELVANYGKPPAVTRIATWPLSTVASASSTTNSQTNAAQSTTDLTGVFMSLPNMPVTGQSKQAVHNNGQSEQAVPSNSQLGQVNALGKDQSVQVVPVKDQSEQASVRKDANVTSKGAQEPVRGSQKKFVRHVSHLGISSKHAVNETKPLDMIFAQQLHDFIAATQRLQDSPSPNVLPKPIDTTFTRDRNTRRAELRVIAQPSDESSEPVVMQRGWTCPTCTYLNEPTRPGCELCSTGRPTNYVAPGHFVMSLREEERIKREKEDELMAQKLAETIRQENFRRLVALQESNDLVPNFEDVKCPICYEVVHQGIGVTLRECQHIFCRRCLHDHISLCLSPRVPCPFSDGFYSCSSYILDREIKQLLTTEEYVRYHHKSLQLAESQERASFHCCTVNCPGRCTFEDYVNTFLCPICGHDNCIICKAQHEKRNCREYQNELIQKAKNNDANASGTVQFLEAQVRKGDTMQCPRCGIYLGEKEGCDWLMCPMCRTEICWVTKGPRWGPRGQGDISGGCRCRVNGKPCHQNCKNCH